MCIKIVCSEGSSEFDISRPLVDQISDAREIVISYDPTDPKIDSFVGQIEVMAKTGIGCNAEIEVKTNNYLDGIRLERIIESLKRKLSVNEVIKGIAKLHADTDHKLDEISQICLGKNNEH